MALNVVIVAEQGVRVTIEGGSDGSTTGRRGIVGQQAQFQLVKLAPTLIRLLFHQFS